MKLKRTSLKVLLSASIILSMIPFSFINTEAEIVNYLGKVYSTSIVGDTRYDYVDYYFSSEYLCNGTITITANNAFVFKASEASYNFAVIDSDQNITVLTTVSTSGSGSTYAIKTVYEIQLHGSGYFHVQVWFTSKISWYPLNDTKTIAGKYGCVDSKSITNTSSGNSDLYSYLNTIITSIQNISGGGGGGVDLSGVIDLMDYIISLMDIQLAYQMSINQKMDLILLQLQTQQGTPSQDSIDDNTQANEDLQTESETYQQLESEFNDNFTDSLENVPTQTLEDHLQTWSTGVNWFRTQMDNIYNNLGEFKYICSIAIVLAIALIFIGR